MLTRIAHICLFTSNLPRLVGFYSKIGCSVQFNFTRKGDNFGTYLKIAPDSFIEIFERETAAFSAEATMNHFCLETDNIDEFIDRLNAAGISYSEKKLGVDNAWQIWLTDPDGNQFEVQQYDEKSMQRADSGNTIEADW
jgi:lactoylglutathione lyase